MQKAFTGKLFPALCIVVICGPLLFSIFYLKTLNKWWFEDDTLQFAVVSKISNPIEFFSNPNILRNFGAGVSPVPIFLVSLWVDLKFFGISPLAARIHSLISFIATVFLVFIVFSRYTKTMLASAFVALIWMCLPATIAVHSFHSTRHYMEGLGWSLLACYWVYAYCHDRVNNLKKIFLFIGIVVCTVLAILSKETYVTVLLSFLFIYGLFKKTFLISAASVILGVAYFSYRMWVVGSTTYPVELLGFKEYLQFLKVIPYTLTANEAGYLIYLGLSLGCVYMLFRKPHLENLKSVIAFSILYISAQIAIFPTASAVLATYQIPGTWYRSPFIISTLVLFFTGYLLIRYSQRKVLFLCLALISILLLPGIQKTRVYWIVRLVRSEQEGKFYLSNPDKLILSEEDAYWFLPGLDSLYGVNKSHYINKQFPYSEHAKQMLETYPTIWRFQGGQFVEDERLYEDIKNEISKSSPP